jgi:hypothetical protein
MNKQVNFEDNIFILMMRTRMIRDMITLGADPELFLEKTLDDICFTNETLGILLAYLEQNQHLIEREERFEQLQNAEEQFSMVLQGLLCKGGNFSVRGSSSLEEKLAVFQKSSLERQKAAGKLRHIEEELDDSPPVSSLEIAELLKAF